jgi:DNA topoisomerase I
MGRFRFIDCSEPGYTRRRRGKSWQYLYPDGRTVKASRTIARLNAIALPPAYRNAWYAMDANAHLQATGVDDRGRTQYRYHPDYRTAREEEKYLLCIDFGKALPCIRRAVEADLARRDISPERVIAAVIRLLDLGSVRVGNEHYAKHNGSFGATTFRNRHATVRGEKVQLEFTGKSGKRQNIAITDGKLARAVRLCLDTPGQPLFQYRDNEGALQPVSSSDVNAYLRKYGGDFTAKHFRTWAGSAIAFAKWKEGRGAASLKSIMEAVSKKLGNTPAIARKSYVHPAIIDAVADNEPPPARLPRATRYMRSDERGLLSFLEGRRA